MADFRYGFFCRPDNKKIESHPEEKSKTSHISDPKSKLAHVDAGGRRQPISVLPGTRYVTTTEKYTEEVYSSTSRDNFQHRHTLNQPIEFNKLIAKAQKESRQPKHEIISLSGPTNDIEKAMEYLKEAVKLHSSKNSACSASDHHKKDSCTKTIDNKEVARRYGNFGASAGSVSGTNVATIDCKEAARKYKGATV